MRRAGLWAMLVALAALVLCLPLLVQDNYTRRLINLAFIWTILTMSLNFILGFAGQLSLGHAGFFAIGAYVSGLLTTRLNLSFPVGLIASILVTGLVGLLLGLPTLRLRSHYLALVTLGFSEVVRLVLLGWKPVTRGTDGVLNIPPPNIGSLVLQGDKQQFYLLLAFTAVLIWLTYRFARSRYGLACRALRDSELAAGAMGISTHRLKLLTFVLSAVFAGIAGTLYAHLYAFLSPEAFGIDVTINTLTMVLIGGAGTVWGPTLGGVLLTFLPEWLRVLKDYRLVVYGLGLVALIIFMPTGLIGAGRSLWQRRRRAKGGKLDALTS